MYTESTRITDADQKMTGWNRETQASVRRELGQCDWRLETTTVAIRGRIAFFWELQLTASVLDFQLHCPSSLVTEACLPSSGLSQVSTYME